MAALYEAWTVFAGSNTGAVSSNSIQGMHVAFVVSKTWTPTLMSLVTKKQCMKAWTGFIWSILEYGSDFILSSQMNSLNWLYSLKAIAKIYYLYIRFIYRNVSRTDFSRNADNVILITVDAETARSTFPSYSSHITNHFQKKQNNNYRCFTVIVFL